MTVETPLGRRLARAPTTGRRRSRPPDPGTPHNEARDQVWDELLAILVDKHEARRGRRRPTSSARSLAQNAELRAPSTGRGRCSRRPTSSATCGRCRPTCACARPGSTPTRSGRCSAPDPQAWTVVRPAAPGRRPAAARRPGGVAPRRRRREAAAAAERERMDRRRRRPDRDRRLRAAADVDAAPARTCGTRWSTRTPLPERRPRPARRPVRARRRRRGAGADRRGVADAAAALPVAQLHHRRRPRPGPARVHRVVAGAARAGRAGPGRPRLADASTTARRRR